MTIKRRIFLTYVVFIALVLSYVGVSMYTRAVRLNVQSDVNAILRLRNTWERVQISLSNLLINWDEGRAYDQLLARRDSFDYQLNQTKQQVQGRYYYPPRFEALFDNLAGIWKVADRHLVRIEMAVERPEFARVEEMVREQPGLQRFSILWRELLDEDTLEARRRAHAIQELTGEVEFFPIYGETVDSLFDVILGFAEQVQHRVVVVERIFAFAFFLVLLVICIVTASRFAHSLSEPVIGVAQKLQSFIGRTGAPSIGEEDDEVRVLSHTVEHLIEHYTDLSERVERLARGEISHDAVQFPRSGIVGRSLDEIAGYLSELAHTSAWIRDGEYGKQIQERSEADVLAHNFNVMSAVIHEKITTLRSMFDSVDEAVLVVDETEAVLETNTEFVKLFGIEEADESRRALVCRTVVDQLRDIHRRVLAGENVTNLYTNLTGIRDCEIPVKLNARLLPRAEAHRNQIMFLISNESWRARAKRERERLRTQAMVAELKALKAQINPHFFFNTLNTIAHLAETHPEDAVATVEKLADLFRYALVATKRDRVRLEEELNHVQRFLDIERLRYGRRLQVEWKIQDDVKHRQLPPMLLQPLVENAVRYGTDADGAVSISIGAYRGEGTLNVEVADQGTEEVDHEQLLHSGGTGIKNVNHRLKTLYGRQIRFRTNTPHGLVAEIRIPV